MSSLECVQTTKLMAFAMFDLSEEEWTSSMKVIKMYDTCLERCEEKSKYNDHDEDKIKCTNQCREFMMLSIEIEGYARMSTPK